MKWLSNIIDPTRPDAKQSIQSLFGQDKDTAWKDHLEWLQGKVIGEPKATKYCTVEQLKGWGYVGVYKDK